MDSAGYRLVSDWCPVCKAPADTSPGARCFEYLLEALLEVWAPLEQAQRVLARAKKAF
jgi:hypothetical protein